MIELSDITVRFGGEFALDAVSARFSAGSVTCLLGGNGAGKSTLIRMLAGDLRPTSGKILIAGVALRRVTRRRAQGLGIRTVYQDRALCPHLTAVQNVFLGHERKRPGLAGWALRRLDWSWMEEEAAHRLAVIGIRLPDLGRSAGALSGGERQALALARVLSEEAAVILLDEPTTGLAEERAQVVYRLIGQWASENKTVIFSSHDSRSAILVADELLVLERGAVVFAGPPDRVGQEVLKGGGIGEKASSASPIQAPVAPCYAGENKS